MLFYLSLSRNAITSTTGVQHNKFATGRPKGMHGVEGVGQGLLACVEHDTCTKLFGTAGGGTVLQGVPYACVSMRRRRRGSMCLNAAVAPAQHMGWCIINLRAAGSCGVHLCGVLGALVCWLGRMGSSGFYLVGCAVLRVCVIMLILVGCTPSTAELASLSGRQRPCHSGGSHPAGWPLSGGGRWAAARGSRACQPPWGAACPDAAA